MEEYISQKRYSVSSILRRIPARGECSRPPVGCVRWQRIPARGECSRPPVSGRYFSHDKGIFCKLRIKKNNERLPIQGFGLTLQGYLGNCSPSIDFLSLVRARSIPCERLANSFDSTIFSKNARFSGEMVTFNDIFFSFTMYNTDSCEDLNIDNDNHCITTITVVGESKHGKQQPLSASAEQDGRERQINRGPDRGRQGTDLPGENVDRIRALHRRLIERSDRRTIPGICPGRGRATLMEAM